MANHKFYSCHTVYGAYAHIQYYKLTWQRLYTYIKQIAKLICHTIDASVRCREHSNWKFTQ